VPTVVPSKAFLRDLKKLNPKHRATAARDALVLFVKNPGHTSLNFERVLSRKGYHTIRASIGDRILLLKDDDAGGGKYTAVAIGDHDYIYKAYFKKR
jgi:hypothetical protein